jgi:hypothetical protein
MHDFALKGTTEVMKRQNIIDKRVDKLTSK